MKTGRLQYIGLGLLTAAVYVASAKMGLSLAFVAEQVTVVWPPTGIALSAVLLLGYRIWPAITLGAFLANLTANAPPATSLGIATGNTLEALVGAYLLNRLLEFHPSLDRFRDIFGLIFFGAIVSTTVSSTIGVTSLCLTGMQPWERFGSLWSVWFLGDGMGDVIVAPLVLTLVADRSHRRLPLRDLPEFIALLILLAVLHLLVFGGRGPAELRYYLYAIFPLLIWSALRFRTSGTAVTVFVTSAIAILATVQGYGPFAIGAVNEGLISLQLFMFVAASTGLIMAAAVSGRDEARVSLRRSEQRYKSLVLASSQVVWSTDAPGEVAEDLPTSRAFTGQTKEEMMGLGWMRMLHPDDIQQVGEAWEQSLATRTPHETEFRVLAGDGTYRNVAARAVPVLEPNGKIREWVGTLTDITEQKNAEREMQEANRRKDEFLAMLAHELRNPLAPIRNAVEIIRSSKTDTAKLNWTCEIMERQVQHMSRLLDDLLDVARITHGQIQLSKEPTDFTTLVRRSLDASRSVLDKKNLRLTSDFVPGPVPIFADGTRIEQVITNLLNNAAKFTPAGGQVTVSVHREGDSAVLRVLDNGSGIAPELLPRIFRLFEQGDRSLARSEGGMGIGLTLVQNLVRMHFGTVEANSEGLDRGSEFIVRLPMMPVVPAQSSKKAADLEAANEKKRVLVVEDNLDSAETLATMLDMMGHEARVANDGPTGIDVFARFKPSIVLLDIGLPGLSGFEVAERLRADPAASSLKIIALTGYGSDSDRARSKTAGFDHHLVKPVDFEVLEKLLRE
jgi:two-component system CheB/CheR fusion protein